MSNSGETGADVTVRGLPQTANSSFRYISLQEDGLPAFEAPGLLFAFPDAMVRLDETVARVEAVRGGSAAVFGSSTPGGIVNLISKTGGPTLGGTIRSATGSQGWSDSTRTSAGRSPASGDSTSAATTATIAACAIPASRPTGRTDSRQRDARVVERPRAALRQVPERAQRVVPRHSDPQLPEPARRSRADRRSAAAPRSRASG